MLGSWLFGIQAAPTSRACDSVYPGVRIDYGQAAIVVPTHPSLYYANVAVGDISP